jgi:hypothetical protein
VVALLELHALTKSAARALRTREHDGFHPSRLAVHAARNPPVATISPVFAREARPGAAPAPCRDEKSIHSPDSAYESGAHLREPSALERAGWAVKTPLFEPREVATRTPAEIPAPKSLSPASGAQTRSLDDRRRRSPGSSRQAGSRRRWRRLDARSVAVPDLGALPAKGGMPATARLPIPDEVLALILRRRRGARR